MCAFLPFLAVNVIIYREQQFVFLAHSFLNGSFSFISLPETTNDLSLFNGKYFWPLGPFPAVIMMPFVLFFKTNFLQWPISFPLTIANFWLVIKIANKLNLSTTKSYFLSIFFIFGSVYTPNAVISFSWYFAHVVATSLLLLVIYEFLNKRRWLIIGTLIAFATLTRSTLILSSVFFLFYLLKKPVARINILKFFLPLTLAVFATFFYNYARFGSIFESGYKYQLIPEESALRRSYGLMSLQHIPSNLYYMLISTPLPVFEDSSHVLKFPYLIYDPYGISIFFMSPLLFLIFKANLKEKFVKASLITSAAIAIPIITYYGIGYVQLGYRYALDFLPFLLFPLSSAIKNTNEIKVGFLVFLGVLITWFFIFEKLAGF